jgi:hypothetical protein
MCRFYSQKSCFFTDITIEARNDISDHVDACESADAVDFLGRLPDRPSGFFRSFFDKFAALLSFLGVRTGGVQEKVARQNLFRLRPAIGTGGTPRKLTSLK